MPFLQPVTRRRLLEGLGLGGLGVGSLGITALVLPVENAFSSAEETTPSSDGDTPSTVYALKAGESTIDMQTARPPVRMWTYDDSLPGPLLRVRQGQEITVNLRNTLPQPTTLHWHGVRLDNAKDGVGGLTETALEPGAERSIRFRAPDAGTFWYRPMTPRHVAEQTARGLQGVLIVDEDVPYAAEDIIIALTDSALDAEGQIRNSFNTAEDTGFAGRLGNVLLINGRGAATELNRPPGTRLRLRLLNMANARPLTVRFDDMRATVIAANGQPVDAPFPPVRNSISLVPGGRVDVVADLPSEAGRTSTVTAVLGNGFPLLSVTTTGEAIKDADLPVAALPQGNLPEALDLGNARRFDLAVTGGLPIPESGKTAADAPPAIADPERVWFLNGMAWADAGKKPLFSVSKGTTVTLALENRTPFLQVLHLHGHHARLLHKLDDGWEPYWLDSIPIPPQQTVRAAFLADNPGRWMIGSGILDRLGAGLAGWFAVE